MTAPATTDHAGTVPATAEGVRAALAALGDSPDRVRANLDHAGHRGEPGESTRCPVAAYLLAILAAGRLRAVNPVAVGDTTVTVFLADATSHEVDLPGPVRGFVAGFDLGEYAYLHPADYVDPETDAGPDGGPDSPGRPTTDTAMDTAPDVADTGRCAGTDGFADTRPDIAGSCLEGVAL
jgi:hypothetical protein